MRKEKDFKCFNDKETMNVRVVINANKGREIAISLGKWDNDVIVNPKKSISSNVLIGADGSVDLFDGKFEFGENHFAIGSVTVSFGDDYIEVVGLDDIFQFEITKERFDQLKSEIESFCKN